MELTVKTAKFTTSPHDNVWSSVFAENGLFVLLEIEGNSGNPAPQKGKEILDKILTDYTNFPQRNLSVIGKLLEKIKDEKNIITAVIGLLGDCKLYIGGKGDGVVLMQRKGKVGRIFQGEEKKEGSVEDGDSLIFYTRKFEDTVEMEKRHNLLLYENPEEAIESIAPFLVENTLSKGMVLLLIKLRQGTEAEKIPDLIDKVRFGNKEKIKALWQRAGSLFDNGEENIYEDNEEKKSKKTLLTIAVILILLLTGSIFLNINHSSNREKQKKMSEVISLVSHQYDEAVSLLELNPIRSRELLTASKLELTPLLSDFPKNSREYKDITDWLGKISSEEVTAYRIYKLTGVPLFFDFNLLKQGAFVQLFAAYKETKVFLDTKNQVVYKLTTPSKQAEIVIGPDVVKDAKAIDIHGKSIYLINSDGIVETNITSKTSRIVIKPDEKWGEVVSLATYGGNIYLLDKKKSIIWKYIATDYGFSARQSYLNPDVRVDLTTGLRMIIDGSVWVLSPDGISKFTKGLTESFVFKGFSDTLQNAVAISAVEGEQYLYVLDKTLGRVIVLDKDGNYFSQYQWDELINATDMLASEEEKKIYVISGSKLYAIDIK